MSTTVNIPMREVGPIKLNFENTNLEVKVPLATYETPLWPSTARGAKISRLTDGIKTTVISDKMTRSIVVEAKTAAIANLALKNLEQNFSKLQKVVSQTSSYAKLIDMHSQIIGNLLYLRFECETGDASGHNMVTKAADRLMSWILEHHPELKYVSISGNFCCDKKVSAVNGILGRGKYTIAEINISREICEKQLRTTPEKLVNLHIKKNLIGTNIAGGLRSANAHFANMLLAIYLATGQDAANIIEASQGMVHAEARDNELYFSVTLPNIIVGTVGNGKELDFIHDNLQKLGCTEANKPGFNAKKLAAIIAATVLCGELSLLAAQTNPGELMRSHLSLERAKRNK